MCVCPRGRQVTSAAVEHTGVDASEAPPCRCYSGSTLYIAVLGSWRVWRSRSRTGRAATAQGRAGGRKAGRGGARHVGGEGAFGHRGSHFLRRIYIHMICLLLWLGTATAGGAAAVPPRSRNADPETCMFSANHDDFRPCSAALAILLYVSIYGGGRRGVTRIHR